MWRAQLPKAVKNAVAGKSLTGGNLDTVLKLADAVYKANGSKPAPQVAGAGAAEQAEGAAGGQLAAFGKKNQKGKKQDQSKQNRNQGQNQTSTSQSRKNKPNTGPRHPDGPPDSVCQKHWQFGKNADYCMNVRKCPWKDYLSPEV